MSTANRTESSTQNWSHTHQKVAVFIDIENFAGSCDMLGVPIDVAPVLKEVQARYGRVLIKQSFGDVCSLPNKRFNSYEIRRHLQSQQVDHLDLPHRQSTYSKNSADMALVVNAVSLINLRPDITHVVVVSGDRDFAPLYNHARAAGRTVIGVGASRALVSDDTINACDEYLFQEDVTLAASTVKARPPTAATPLGAPPIQPLANSIMTAQAKSTTFTLRSRHLSGPQSMPEAAAIGPNTSCAESAAVAAATTAPSAPAPHTTFTDAPQTGSPEALLNQYQYWVQSKLKIAALPARPVRETIYEHMVTLLQRHSALGLPLRLKRLAYLVAIEMADMPDAQVLAFRLGFGLFKGQAAFDFRATENAFDPEILGVAVERDQLDGCFTLNLQTSFRNDAKNHGLPFQQEVFQRLLSGAPTGAQACAAPTEAHTSPARVNACASELTCA